MDFITLYFIIIAPSIGIAFAFLGFIAAAIGAVAYAAGLADDCYWHNKQRKSWFIIPCIIWVIGLGIPTQEQMKYLIGGYFVSNIEDVNKLPKNIVNTANKFLEDYIKEEKK